MRPVFPGASLYTALTGKFPFGNGSPMQTMQRKFLSQYVPLRLLLPSLNPALDRLVNRCLEASPLQRPSDCDEFIAVLQSCQACPAVPTDDEVIDLTSRKPRASSDRRASLRSPST